MLQCDVGLMEERECIINKLPGIMATRQKTFWKYYQRGLSWLIIEASLCQP